MRKEFDLKKETEKSILLRNRISGEIQKETVFGDKVLRFFYETLLGRGFWGLFFNSSCLSRLFGMYYDSGFSRKSIASLAAIDGCNAEEAALPLNEYTSFNAFFTRKLKEGSRPFDADKEILSSPSDGRIFVYENLRGNDPIPVKGAEKTLQELCCGLLPENKSFAVAVVRLAPVDYHRYHFPCACEQKSAPVVIRGKYHSVNPVALKRRPDLFVENTRQITILESAEFGRFYFLEVGAFGVGSIVQSSEPGRHEKLSEKGYFKFGGSTVILIFEDEKLQWDADLLQSTSDAIESLVQCGMSIGKIKK